MRKIMLALILLLAISTATSMAGEKLVIATEGAYPPFNYLNSDGQPAGFDVDIALALCQAMNVECRIVVVPWDRIITDLRAGKYDAVVASMARTPEREKLVDFTDKYYRTTTSFVGKSGSWPEISPQTLAGRIVATQEKTIYAEYLEKNYKNVIKPRFTTTQDEAFELLTKGQADLVLGSSLVCLNFLKSPQGRDFDYVGATLAEGDLSTTANIAVAKGRDNLRESFDLAIATIRLQGVYDRINKKYFPFNIY